jgi:hypothetical protein
LRIFHVAGLFPSMIQSTSMISTSADWCGSTRENQWSTHAIALEDHG